MIKYRLTRRQFFKASVLSAAAAVGLPAIGLAAVAAAPTQEALASAQQPQGPAIPQPTFNPIASNTSFGPLTDISMGWDGTVWGIDGQGAPHVFDPINNLWAQHGDSIDAAALNGTFDTIYVFQGPNVVPINAATMTAGTPTTIAALWPTLPDSFKLGVNGAMTSRDGNGLILFNGGRYVSTDGTLPLSKLTDLTGWPQTAPWTVTDPKNPAIKDAVIDAAFTILTPGSQYLLRAGQVLRVRVFERALDVPDAPVSFAAFVQDFGPPLPADWISSGGVDAITMTNASNQTNQLFFKGTSVLAYNLFSPASTTTQYIGATFKNWPATWHPVLQHAPNGRDGNLWSVLPSAQGSWTVQHNGDSWIQLPNQADHVGVGQDNTVMLASAGRLWRFTGALDGTGFTPLTPPSNLIQVSLGNANAVNARDTNGNVYGFDAGTNALTQNTAVGTVSHIATTSDGSLWHAKPSSPTMHRQLLGSGASPEAIPVKNGLTATVNKVAGAGFGAAHCLTQDTQGNTQAYRYDSPYVFKSAKQYNVDTVSGVSANVEQGAGLLFLIDTQLVQVLPTGVFVTQIVAVDAHTGVEVARTPQLPAPMNYGQPVFDPIHNLVYVATTNTSNSIDTTPGQLLALDARTLAVKWTFTAAASIDATPTLNGGRLCFGDRTGKLYLIDTAAALANPTNVQPVWTVDYPSQNTFDPPLPTIQTYRIATPLFVTIDGTDWVYSAIWYCSNFGTGSIPVAMTIKLKAIDGTRPDFATDIGNGFPLVNPQESYTVANLATVLSAPVRGTGVFQYNQQNGGAPPIQPAIYFNCNDRVTMLNIGAGTQDDNVFRLSPGDYIATGFTYDDGRGPQDSITSTPPPPDAGSLWFGSSTGQLYCLNTSLSPINYTPASIAPPNQSYFYTTPTLYKDAQGNVTVFFNSILPNINPIPSLYGFSPDNGNVAALPTGATTIAALSKTVTHGVLYAAGVIEDDASTASQFPQVFAIRVDQLVQAERDFVIESQLMQDPQDPGGTGGSTVTTSDGNIIPNSVARYQTHLTVVDDKKHPLPNEPVKIWADIAGTIITVDGTQYTIGPDDLTFAAVKTGTDGSVVIVSEATDVNTSALRVWAAFMDPFERIMVYPDHEWHGRVTQSNVNDAQPDPAKPNLNKAYKYDGTPLFTDADKQQKAPDNVASAVGQMNTGLNPGGNSPASVAGALKTLHGSNPIAPYVAYTTLSGMHYGPNNARAKRTATIAAPFGFQLTRQGSTHTYTPLSHSDARSNIDTLPYPLWDPKNPSGKPNGTTSGKPVQPIVFVVRRSDNIFSDFWNWLVGAFKQAVDTIENVIVSVADDIMVGINFIIDGVQQAFKAIIKVIEDVVNAIGSFFLQLLKAIEDLIAALSILFHFGEIIWTHTWLENMLAYQKEQLKTIVAAHATDVDTFLNKSEDTIKGFIEGVKAQINGQQSFNTMPGAGATAHSAMTAGPGQAGNTNSGSSQAVQGGWGIQKMKSGFGSQAGSPSLAVANATAKSASPKATVGDPVTDFVTGFIDSLKNNTDLSNALSNAKNDISNTFTAKSPSAFFTGLLSTLLDILELLLDSALALSKAIFDGAIKALDDIIDAIWAAIDDPIDFPVISWLYKLLFKEDLTLLNLATLVVAIPVTVIYRVVAGEYPQDSHNATPYSPWQTNASAMQAGSPQDALAGIAPDWAQKFIGTASGLFNLVYGLINAFNDFFYPLIKSGVAKGFGPLVGWLGNIAVGLSLVNAALGYPGFSTDLAKISLGTWFTYPVTCLLACFGVTGLSTFSWDDATSEGLGVANAVAYAILLIGFVSDFAVNGGRDVNSDLNFSSNLIGCLPSMINPIKYINPELAFLDSGVDLFSGVATCALGIAATWHSQPTAEPERRVYYLPWVASSPTP